MNEPNWRARAEAAIRDFELALTELCRVRVNPRCTATELNQLDQIVSNCRLAIERLFEETGKRAEAAEAELERVRKRQIEKEGWTGDHDDEHQAGELPSAAIVYARIARSQGRRKPPFHSVKDWPWSLKWFKPSEDPIRNLEKAGALIAAEIDRLLREKENEP